MLDDLIRIIVIGAALVLVAYAVVRAASFAYFRTYFEHWRAVRKEEMKENGDK